jgi:hypothetical protein
LLHIPTQRITAEVILGLDFIPAAQLIIPLSRFQLPQDLPVHLLDGEALFV